MHFDVYIAQKDLIPNERKKKINVVFSTRIYSAK